MLSTASVLVLITVHNNKMKRVCNAVDTLRGPLEGDVQEAAVSCWVLEEGLVHVGPKLHASHLTKTSSMGKQPPAVLACGSFPRQGCQEQTKPCPAQVRKSFGLRDKPVRVVNALLDTAAERELLEPALTRWQQTAMGAVASTGLELHVACHRVSWLTHRCAGRGLICCNCAG